jgi:hypothetical protein
VLLAYSKNWMEQYAPQLGTFYKGKIKKLNVNTTHPEWFKPAQIKTIVNEIKKNQNKFEIFEENS